MSFICLPRLWKEDGKRISQAGDIAVACGLVSLGILVLTSLTDHVNIVGPLAAKSMITARNLTVSSEPRAIIGCPAFAIKLKSKVFVTISLCKIVALHY